MQLFTAALILSLATLLHGRGWPNPIPHRYQHVHKSPSCRDALEDAIYALQAELKERDQQLLGEIQQLREEVQAIRDDLSNTVMPPIGSFCNPASSCEDIFAQGINITGTYWLNNGSEVVNVTCDFDDQNLPTETPTNPTIPPLPSSCRELFNQRINTTGTYSLNTDSGVVNVICDFDVQLPPPDPMAGWQEIVSSDGTNCPLPLLNADGVICFASQNNIGGCNSVFIPTNGVPFSRLCGQIEGTFDGIPEAFETTNGVCSPAGCDSIDDPYVDGISITYNDTDSNRQHIWSLAANGLLIPGSSVCPCGNLSFTTPDFVGDNYYCEAQSSFTTLLWEGQGCTDIDIGDGPCCENANFPYFCREFDQPIVTENIEIRLCTDENTIEDEIIAFQSLRMYIQ